MSENKLPEFNSVKDLVDFFDEHDMGEYDLDEAEFDVNIRKRTFLIEVDIELMKRLSQAAKAHQTSTGELVNAWLEEKASEAA